MSCWQDAFGIEKATTVTWVQWLPPLPANIQLTRRAGRSGWGLGKSRASLQGFRFFSMHGHNHLIKFMLPSRGTFRNCIGISLQQKEVTLKFKPLVNSTGPQLVSVGCGTDSFRKGNYTIASQDNSIFESTRLPALLGNQVRIFPDLICEQFLLPGIFMAKNPLLRGTPIWNRMGPLYGLTQLWRIGPIIPQVYILSQTACPYVCHLSLQRSRV